MSGDDTTALPQSCLRCGALAMIRVVGRCAVCIGEMGLSYPPDHKAWRDELTREVKQA